MFEAFEAGHLQRFERALAACFRIQRAGLESELGVGDDGPPRQQPVFLEHVADDARVLRRALRDSIDLHTAAVRLHEARDDVEQRALAQPDAPTIASTEPAGAASEMSSSTGSLP